MYGFKGLVTSLVSVNFDDVTNNFLLLLQYPFPEFMKSESDIHENEADKNINTIRADFNDKYLWRRRGCTSITLN